MENEAAIICARLLRQGYLKKTDFPQLELNEHLLLNVRNRLSDVGMELVLNSYSTFYAIRLTQESQDTIEDSNNIGLKTNEVAMLVILWSKLILPKRTSYKTEQKTLLETPEDKITEVTEVTEVTEEEGEIPVIKQEQSTSPLDNLQGKNPLANIDLEDVKLKKTPKDENRIYIKFNELYAEFGKHFGSKTTFKSTLSRLNNLKFIRMHNEIISEGLLLDLLIDGYQMGNEIKKSALAHKLAGLSEDDYEEWDEVEDEDEDFLDLSDELVISQIEISKDTTE